MVVRRALLLAWLLAAPVAAQDTPIPPTAQHIICDSGCGSPPASADGSAFTAGVTNVSLIGAAFNDALADLTAGQYGAPRITKQRAIHVNFRDAAGTEIPFPAALSGGGFKVTCISGCAGSNPNGQATMANSAPVVIASDQTAFPVTASAGTNLNTSALALEAGNLATVKTNTDRPTTVLNGVRTVTTAGTRVTLTAGSTTARSVTIKALIANTGIIYVGSVAVTSANGFPLNAGDTVTLAVGDLQTVNLDSSVNGEGVSYAGVN